MNRFVLDFSRMERGEKKYNFARCDLAGVVRETVDSYRPQLEAAGFRLDWEPAESPVCVNGDRDALAQGVVNLLSNAEKYSGARKEIAVELRQRTEPVSYVEVRVLDRGMGVPRGCESKIFEQFYRAHDSLSSGIQGLISGGHPSPHPLSCAAQRVAEGRGGPGERPRPFDRALGP